MNTLLFFFGVSSWLLLHLLCRALRLGTTPTARGPEKFWSEWSIWIIQKKLQAFNHVVDSWRWMLFHMGTSVLVESKNLPGCLLWVGFLPLLRTYSSSISTSRNRANWKVNWGLSLSFCWEARTFVGTLVAVRDLWHTYMFWGLFISPSFITINCPHGN